MNKFNLPELSKEYTLLKDFEISLSPRESDNWKILNLLGLLTGGGPNHKIILPAGTVISPRYVKAKTNYHSCECVICFKIRSCDGIRELREIKGKNKSEFVITFKNANEMVIV